MTQYVAWLRTPRGVPELQIWRELQSCEPWYGRADAKNLFIAKHEIKPEEEKLPIDELKKLYPCPAVTR